MSKRSIYNNFLKVMVFLKSPKVDGNDADRLAANGLPEYSLFRNPHGALGLNLAAVSAFDTPFFGNGGWLMASKSYKAPARIEQFVGTGTLLAESFNLPNNRKGER
jgi:hypothetical protein